MKTVKKLGYPLMLASVVLFSAARRAEGLTLSWIAAALMLLGMVFFVAGVFIPYGKEAGAPPPPPPPRPARPDAVPEPKAVDVPAQVPAWVYVAAFAVSLGGVLLYFNGPNGVSPRTVGTFAMIPGGVAFFVVASFVYGDAVRRRNTVRGILAGAGFLLIVGAIFTGVLIAAGAFDAGEVRYYGAAAGAGLAVGLVLVYFTMKYMQSEEAVVIGRRLGFTDTDPGVTSEDGEYDSKGVMNGVETLFNIEQGEGGRNARARFSLDVLCRCVNPSGVRLEVRPEGLGTLVNLSGLQRVSPLLNWEFYDVRTNFPDVAARLLPPLRDRENVFTDEAGFTALSLSETGLKASFLAEGYVGTAYVKRVLEEVTKLASAFN